MGSISDTIFVHESPFPGTPYLAADLLADMRRLDEQMCKSKKKLAAAVGASGTSLTNFFGVGPFVTATVIGDVADVSRFASRDHFAAYNGTAPVEVSSEALRSLKRRISNAIYARLRADARHAASSANEGPGRATGERH